MGHDLRKRLRRHKISADKLSVAHAPSDRLTMKDLIEEIKSAKAVIFYLKRPLPSGLLKALKDVTTADSHPLVEVVAEDLEDIAHLRTLHSIGFSLYYGLGLPSRSIIFLNPDRGVFLEEERKSSNRIFKPLKDSKDLYLSLLWQRFGVAVVLSGRIKETDSESGLYCLVADGQREQWFRLKDPSTTNPPQVGSRVELFAWERWGIQILEVLEIAVLEEREAYPP